MRTYRGNCHCGAVVFEAELPEITSVHECNCSICHKKGYLGLFPHADAFRFVKGSDVDMTSYTFGPKKLVHKFCPTCATPLMAEFVDAPPEKRWVLNARAIQGLDLWNFPREHFDGTKLGDVYEPPAYQGALPSAAATDTDTKLYTGSCHCGRVGVALVSKPLDETFDERRVECNCSICERNAYYWIYPARSQVVLAGDEADIGRYAFARRFLTKTFCRVCGVAMTNDANPKQDEVPADLQAGLAEWTTKHHPVNLRVFPDVDLARLKPAERFDGATKLPPAYVNP
ncbi:glutathione-dependent formaldehyde-activating gfa [Hirsutella rhossiliensis]|uniref:Glutathione-dependent formaldehyde-activating gfa n=1 Tax=Hirsutella rhossiliensis TaxID=111463 RepID=A0A9P8N7R9_9HYPO|nr:glutathione-dependent formaldehyde-activating gfa [Hirsutella rhossiliensis]KAH0968107.1 glutathione-dependent formaldehyde-activating gfa [Hirsutella rhossiliensis]